MTRGFTLVEVIVAIALTGVAAGLAVGMFRGVETGADAAAAAADRADRSANRIAWLERAFSGVAAGVADSTGFRGVDGGLPGQETDQVQFATWSNPEGGLTPLRVTLRLEVDGRVRATAQGMVARTLADDVVSLGMDYLAAPGANSAWVRTWESPVSAPVAVRLRVRYRAGPVDTLLLPCGPLP